VVLLICIHARIHQIGSVINLNVPIFGILLYNLYIDDIRMDVLYVGYLIVPLLHPLQFVGFT